MITRRDWLRKGSKVTIGETLVSVGPRGTAKAVPAEQTVAPLSVEGCLSFHRSPNGIGQVITTLHFAPDGSFRIEPYTFDHEAGRPEAVHGDVVQSGPNASARDLIEALTAAAGR